MNYRFEDELKDVQHPVILGPGGEPVLFVRTGDVWGPLGASGPVPGHENARFMLAVLNGQATEFPGGATPSPWCIERATEAAEAGVKEPQFDIVAFSPEGREALAYVSGFYLALAELIVDEANRLAQGGPGL